MIVKKLLGFGVCKINFPSVPSKERPRYNSRSHTTYTPRSTRAREKEIRTEWLNQVGHKWATFAGPCEVQIMISRPIPKGAPKRLIGTANLLKPDIDNTAKLILDALNHYAYKDDKYITCLSVAKAPRIKAGEPASIYIRIDYFQEVEVANHK